MAHVRPVSDLPQSNLFLVPIAPPPCRGRLLHSLFSIPFHPNSSSRRRRAEADSLAGSARLAGSVRKPSKMPAVYQMLCNDAELSRLNQHYHQLDSVTCMQPRRQRKADRQYRVLDAIASLWQQTRTVKIFGGHFRGYVYRRRAGNSDFGT